eukprot:3398426-Lingulodinium_polyedra.AAC.1
MHAAPRMVAAPRQRERRNSRLKEAVPGSKKIRIFVPAGDRDVARCPTLQPPPAPNTHARAPPTHPGPHSPLELDRRAEPPPVMHPQPASPTPVPASVAPQPTE